ncbi:MAG: hypothetical protein N2247_04225 [Leptospiraceae bacterium]|jgi:hypothetical protein|nr:hypothetical protein [Leptospiraceae bacterium]
MKAQNFFTCKKNTTSINITPFHYQFLIQLTKSHFNGNLSLTIDYLFRKYLAYLYKISLAPTKKTLTATYQPRTKNYIIRKINIQPTYWGKLHELRFFLGLSVSYIIRIMLDWEMQEEEIPIVPLFIKPQLTSDDEHIHALIQIGNNYSSYNRVSHLNLQVYSVFLCPAS